MNITIKPVKGRTPTDEKGRVVTEETTVTFSEFWARRVIDGDFVIIKQKGTNK